MQPASNKQAIAEINESLGLGLDQYVAQRKVALDLISKTNITKLSIGGQSK